MCQLFQFPRLLLITLPFHVKVLQLIGIRELNTPCSGHNPPLDVVGVKRSKNAAHVEGVVDGHCTSKAGIRLMRSE